MKKKSCQWLQEKDIKKQSRFICGECTTMNNRKKEQWFWQKSLLCLLWSEYGRWGQIVANTYFPKNTQKHLCQRNRCIRISIKFDISTFWPQQQNHIEDCYFCFISIATLNKKKQTSVNYPSLNLPMRPIPDYSEIQIAVFNVFASSEIEESDHPNANNFVDTVDNDNWNDFERLSSGY